MHAIARHARHRDCADHAEDDAGDADAHAAFDDHPGNALACRAERLAQGELALALTNGKGHQAIQAADGEGEGHASKAAEQQQAETSIGQRACAHLGEWAQVVRNAFRIGVEHATQ